MSGGKGKIPKKSKHISFVKEAKDTMIPDNSIAIDDTNSYTYTHNSASNAITIDNSYYLPDDANDKIEKQKKELEDLKKTIEAMKNSNRVNIPVSREGMVEVMEEIIKTEPEPSLDDVIAREVRKLK